MLHLVILGLATGLSLIVAIGGQNAFVLRQGIARSHLGAVVALCTLSDVVLIAAGVAGVGAVVEHAGWALVVVRWLGAAFLVGYGVSALWRARRTDEALTSAPARSLSRRSALTQTFALTWLNPHVYLDTVLLLGSVASTHGHGRWWFGLGAATGSLVWFVALGYGARVLSPVFARPAAWRLLDAVVGLTMLVVAWGLVST